MNKIKLSKPELRRKIKVRAKIKSTARGIKLSVYRSNRYISGQLVNMLTGKTILGLSDRVFFKGKKEILAKTKSERAFKLGEEIAKLAREKGVKKIVFDRGSFKYHGRVKALADGARQGGLKF